MRKQFFYQGLAVIFSFICLCGCNEGSSDNSQSGKKALDDTESSHQSSVSETAVTSLTPLQTFERVTTINKTTEKSDKQDIFTKKATAEDISREYTSDDEESDWFSENKLFDIEPRENVISTDFIQTWYRFPSDDDTTYTTVVPVEE